MGEGCAAGGILKLLELIEEHPAEITYDFRARFGLSISSVGDDISWLEAAHLTAILLRDPTSWTQAALNGWKHPVSYEWMVQAQTFDLLHLANAKNKPKPMPRPWGDPSMTRTGKPAVSDSRVREVLDAMRPEENNG